MFSEILVKRGDGADARAACVAKHLPVANADGAAERAAKFDGGRDQRVENRLQIERRSADDLEHVRSRGLKLQRLGKIARARLHLVEQAHVLDRNHRLLRERFDKRDLFVGKRFGVELVDRNGPHELVALKHWDRGNRPDQIHVPRGICVIGI